MHNLLCLDSHLGRVDRTSFSQLTLMELLFQDTDALSAISDISSLHGLEFNEKHEIITIEWAEETITGKLDLRWIPLSIRSLNLSANLFTGTLNFESLPEHMVEIDNAFCGEINLCHLPKDLETLILSYNKLGGPLNLENLPRRLVTLKVNHNRFSGNVNLTELPNGLANLFINFNDLNGTICVTRLPSNLLRLNISFNNFIGETDFSLMPRSLVLLNISHTKLSGHFLPLNDSMVVRSIKSNVRIIR